MKAGWQTRKLGEMCEVIGGGTPSKGKAHSAFYSGNILWATVRDMKKDMLSETEFKITKEAVKASSTNIIPKGNVIIATRVGLGKVCLLQNDTAINQDLRGIVPKDGSKLAVAFLFWWLKSISHLIEREGTGATVKGVKLPFIKSLKIPIPSFADQHRIVTILDEVFAGIATATANAERNLHNARELFESYLKSVFRQHDGQGFSGNESDMSVKTQIHSDFEELHIKTYSETEIENMNSGRATKTGGRDATLRHIPGDLSLAVGMPKIPAKKGWRWSPLSELARLESGHTPSRKHPEYWGGTIPWIGIQDAKNYHGQRITDTTQKTNKLGIENSSARVLPENTVCLSRTASVGYVVVMGKPMATSQDFVNWVCSKRLIPDFLKYLFLAEGKKGFLRYSSGAIHQTIYFPEAKAFHICYPETEEQVQIIQQCDSLHKDAQRLESICQQKHTALNELKLSILHRAFSGQLH